MGEIVNALLWLDGKLFYILIPIIIVATALLIARFMWQKKTAQLLGGTEGPQPLLKNFSLTRKFSKVIFMVLSLVFLMLALARPSWGSEQQTISQEGRDVLIALDISRSMLAQDCKPSRLECAKSKIKELLTQLVAERVSLLVFSGVAMIQCPFTTDTQAFLNFLDMADAESISSGTTALDAALEKALSAFEHASGRKKKLVLLFTDGEDFSQDLPAIKKKAEEKDLHLFIIGVGSPEGAPIPLYDDKGSQKGHLKDETGNTVMTRLNESLLAQLGENMNGAYIRMTQTDEDIRSIISYVHHFEKEKFDDTTLEVRNEKYFVFAALSALFLFLEWIL